MPWWMKRGTGLGWQPRGEAWEAVTQIWDEQRSSVDVACGKSFFWWKLLEEARASQSMSPTAVQLQANKKSTKALVCILHDCQAPEPKDEHLSGEDHCNNFVISKETETEILTMAIIIRLNCMQFIQYSLKLTLRSAPCRIWWMKLHSSDISQDTPPLGVPMASPGEVTPPLPDEDSVTPPFEAFRFFFFFRVQVNQVQELQLNADKADPPEPRVSEPRRKGKQQTEKLGWEVYSGMFDVRYYLVLNCNTRQRDTTPLIWAGTFMNVLSKLAWWHF